MELCEQDREVKKGSRIEKADVLRVVGFEGVQLCEQSGQHNQATLARRSARGGRVVHERHNC